MNIFDIEKTLAKNMIKNLCYSTHSLLSSGNFVLISPCFTCPHVFISFSSLLIDFFLRFSSLVHFRIALPLLDSVCSKTTFFFVSDTGLFVIKSALFYFVSFFARFVNFSIMSCTYTYYSTTCFIFPSPFLDAHAFAKN